MFRQQLTTNLTSALRRSAAIHTVLGGSSLLGSSPNSANGANNANGKRKNKSKNQNRVSKYKSEGELASRNGSTVVIAIVIFIS